MHNPLRSEAEMFRLVVIFGVAAAAVIVLSVTAGPEFGVVLAALLLGVGIGFVWAASRGSEPQRAEVASAGDSAFRVLVVANQTVGGEALLEEIRNRCRGRTAEVMVTVPALPGSRLAYWASATDEAVEEAKQRLAESLAAIENLGIQARGQVGDQDPNVAMADALRAFPADELIISTHPASTSKWLDRGVVEKARDQVDLPVTHVVVDLAAEGVA